MRSLILSTAALSLAALAQGCIAAENMASAKPARLATVPYLFLGGLVLFILAFAKPLRGERRGIWWKALLTLMGLVLAFVAYLYLTQGEHFLLAVAFSLLSVVLLGGAFGQEDGSGQGQVIRGDSRITALEGLLLLLAVATALLALFAWWRELDPKAALGANFLSLALFISACWSLDRRARIEAPPTEKPSLPLFPPQLWGG